MKDIFKKWWFYVTIIVILIIIVTISLLITNRKTIYYDYKEQTIEIFNNYKKGKYDNEEVATELLKLESKLEEEIKKDDTSKKKVLENATILKESLHIYAIGFGFKTSPMTNSGVNDFIKEIEKIKL